MVSCYSFAPKSYFKPPHPGKLAGKEAFLIKRIPIFLNSSCNFTLGLRVTKPSWKHHPHARLWEAFGSTWFLSRRIRIHKSTATSPLLSLLRKLFLKLPQLSSQGHLVHDSWWSLCLSSALEAWVLTETPSPGQGPFCRAQLKVHQFLLPFPCSDDSEMIFLARHLLFSTTKSESLLAGRVLEQQFKPSLMQWLPVKRGSTGSLRYVHLLSPYPSR